MDKAQKHNIEPKRPDTKEYVPYDSTYIKFKTRQRSSVLTSQYGDSFREEEGSDFLKGNSTRAVYRKTSRKEAVMDGNMGFKTTLLKN